MSSGNLSQTKDLASEICILIPSGNPEENYNRTAPKNIDISLVTYQKDSV